MDAFFASVEQRDAKSLRGKPIAVGFDSPRSVVSTASYEARTFGVHSAMPMSQAKQLCKELIIVPPRFDVYEQVSNQVRQIMRNYTDIIETISIDEAFLDVTENKVGEDYAIEIAKKLKCDILYNTFLTSSAGVSYNKFLAKIASDWKKPDGLFVIHPLRALDFIAKLPVEKIWGIGPRHWSVCTLWVFSLVMIYDERLWILLLETLARLVIRSMIMLMVLGMTNLLPNGKEKVSVVNKQCKRILLVVLL